MIHPTPDGGDLASGISTVKVDSSGNVLWSKLHIGGGGNVNGTSVTPDGGSLLTGEGQNGNTGLAYNLVVTRMDAGGVICGRMPSGSTPANVPNRSCTVCRAERISVSQLNSM